MSIQIIPKAPSILGRIGKGIGRGLSEQLPKEVERYRLSQGLEKLGKNKDLSPFEQFAELSSVPGVTPQMIQSGSELLRQQARGNQLKALSEKEKNKPSPFKQTQPGQPQTPSKTPSLTTEETAQKTQEGFIPRTEEQKLQAAGQQYNENPALFGNDPQKAIDYQNKIDETNEKIASAYQKKHENLDKIQSNVVDRLKAHSDRLGVKIPSNVYSTVEDKAILATKPKAQGGEGKTEQQSMKDYGKELDEISRQYSGLANYGGWLGVTGRPAKETLTNLKALQKDFAKRDDTKNMGDKLIGDVGLSPQIAYSIAEPISSNGQLSSAIKSLPKLQSKWTMERGFLEGPQISSAEASDKTLEIAPKLFDLIKAGKGSPLAVGYELQKKGYDPQAWRDYAIENQGKLTQDQVEQLYKPESFTGTLSDWWLQAWTGAGE